MTASPTLTTHYLAQSDPRQHAFPHSPNTSEAEMEEKENVNQNRQIIDFQFRTMFVFSSVFELTGTYVAPLLSCGIFITNSLVNTEKNL
jgi:hypothetical protein